MEIIRISQGEFKKLMSEIGINDSNVLSIDTFYICINSTGWIHAIPYFQESHDNVINLYFDDVEKSGKKEIKWFNNTTRLIDAVAMSTDQAIELVNFIDKIPKQSKVYVYCAKGASRSGAVENYIKTLHHIDEDLTQTANKYVYNLLCEAKRNQTDESRL